MNDGPFSFTELLNQEPIYIYVLILAGVVIYLLRPLISMPRGRRASSMVRAIFFAVIGAAWVWRRNGGELDVALTTPMIAFLAFIGAALLFGLYWVYGRRV